jgi:hypothetical protein
MHVAFINYGDFQGPCGVHVFHLANALADKNIKTSVIVPHQQTSVRIFGEPKFDTYSFIEAKRITRKKFFPDIIHAWTPRETTRKMTLFLSKCLKIPYIVHMEDNEEAIINSILNNKGVSIKIFNKILYFNPLITMPFSHPQKYKRFIKNFYRYTFIV